MMLTSILAGLAMTQAAGLPADTSARTTQAQSQDFGSQALSEGRGNDVIASLEKARAKNADDPAILINLGVAYAHRGDDEMARQMFTAAMRSRTVIELETAHGEPMNSRKLARKALAMLARGELRMASMER